MKKRVLWIDDNIGILQPLVRSMAESGFECVVSSDNDDAIEKLMNFPPFDLIITDVIRPIGGKLDPESADFGRSTGLAFYDAYLRDLQPRVPIVFFTVRSDATLQEKISELPDAHLLSKPMRPSDLIAFAQAVLSKETELLYEYREPDAESARIVRVDFSRISEELIMHLLKYPDEIYRLQPRRFEELVAELFADLGYQVALTPETRDKGVDIYAAKRDPLGDLLYVVECKQYQPHRKVGVGHVRTLYGVKSIEQASAAILVTSSFFSSDAEAFQAQYKHEISLKDYYDIRDWLRDYPKGIRGSYD